MERLQLQYVPFLFAQANLPAQLPPLDEPWPLDDEASRKILLEALTRQRSQMASRSFDERRKNGGVGGFFVGLLERVGTEVANELIVSEDDLLRQQDDLRRKFGQYFGLLAKEAVLFGFACSLVAPIVASPTGAAELSRGEVFVTDRSVCFSSESFNAGEPFVKVAIPWSSVAVMRQGVSTRAPSSSSGVPVLEPAASATSGCDGLLLYTSDQRVHVLAEFATPQLAHLCFVVLERSWRRSFTAASPPPPYVAPAAVVSSSNQQSANPYLPYVPSQQQAPPPPSYSLPSSQYAPPVPARPHAAPAGRGFESGMQDSHRNNPFCAPAWEQQQQQQPVSMFQPPPPTQPVYPTVQSASVAQSSSAHAQPGAPSPFSNPYK